ncbi:MAG: group III truncated hemoglobin [Bacteroidia bacterium]
MKKDISTKEDIKLLVDTFYNKVQTDSKIGYVFNDVVKVNWEEHLPKMYGFWQILLLGQVGVQSNPMQKHIDVNGKEKLTEAHFNQWVTLWFKTLDELFEGENTNMAKERTMAIKQTLMLRVGASKNESTS